MADLEPEGTTAAIADEGPVSATRHGARDLTQGPITRTLIAFMLPALGSSVLQALNGSINTIWIGRLLGEDASCSSCCRSCSASAWPRRS
jgi:hypothetical protein